MIINIVKESPLRYNISYEYKHNGYTISQSYENLSSYRVREVVDIITEQFLNTEKNTLDDDYTNDGTAD